MGRTLVVERHVWETSGSGHQIQFPTAAFNGFFGAAGNFPFEVFDPPHRAKPKRTVVAKVSAYGKSATYRLNKVLEIGSLGPGFVLIEELGEKEGVSRYAIWWFTGVDAMKIARRKWKWRRAKGSQHGPGRHWVILPKSGPRSA